MTDSNPHLAKRRPPSELGRVISMSIPVVLIMTSRALMDIVDFSMVSHLPTDAAQAAILPAQVVMWSYIVLGMGTLSIISTFTSQCLGRGDKEQCGAYAWQMLYLSAAFGLLGLVALPTLPGLIAWLNHAPEVQACELAYARVAVLSAGPTIAAQGLSWFFIGIHRPWIPAWSALEGNVVNIVVSAVLIFGLLGAPAMGIAGAAWGTVAAVSYRATRLAITLLLPKMAEQFGTRRNWRPGRALIVRLLRVGIPCGLQWTSEVVVWAIFINVLVGTFFGTTHQLATNVAWQYLRISFLPTVGVGHAITSLVGRAIGAGAPEQAVRLTRMAVGVTMVYLGTLSIVYFLFGGPLIALFNDQPEVVKLGAQIMICAAVFQLFDALGIAYTSALRGAGDTLWPAVFFVVSQWLIIVGGGWLVATLYPQWGSLGPWWAAATLIIITALYLWWRWHSRAWMRIDIFGDGRQARDTDSVTAEAGDGEDVRSTTRAGQAEAHAQP